MTAVGTAIGIVVAAVPYSIAGTIAILESGGGNDTRLLFFVVAMTLVIGVWLAGVAKLQATLLGMIGVLDSHKRWLFGTTLGGSAGWLMVGIPLAGWLDDASMAWTAFGVLGAAIGGGVGVGQWQALPEMARKAWWILTTTLGFVSATLVTVWLVATISDAFYPLLPLILVPAFGVVLGIVTGIPVMRLSRETG